MFLNTKVGVKIVWNFLSSGTFFNSGLPVAVSTIACINGWLPVFVISICGDLDLVTLNNRC